ncbi:multicopper oxidase family protein [Bacillus horti]|uniref:FtsP/CotA-like multicopper oxidase with cupredoxin domain n=1 Tax=Caldalkalibacillus horti TaxID=77523 RepID=A0ABT9VZU3_9BACI|nr:multicopper oxidase family protein [Bacillus horti]MDQ0166528.1 FtsP/CotA-like multicopper oxidase with cupredoxin domain [Bacillus horti]
MLETLYGIEIILLAALAGVWTITAIFAANIKHALIHEGKLDMWKLLTRVGIRVGMLIFVLWLLLQLSIVLFLGWLFAADRILVALPILLLAALAVLVFSRSKANRISGAQEKEMILLLVPIQTMMAASLVSNALVMFIIPAIPHWFDTIYYFYILLLVAAILWLYQRWSIKSIRRKKHGVVKRFVKNAIILMLGFIGVVTWMVVGMELSKLPENMEMVHHDKVDYGGGIVLNDHFSHAEHSEEAIISETEMISVTDLTGPQEGQADKSFKLEAAKKMVQLSSGVEFEAWTFNGQFPGPELVVQEGDLVEIKLVNKDIEAGVTIHWHGVDVPNAEDGVAGMTQNAVRPGETYTYRFIVEETGSHWYHSHQVSSVQVQKGLFGAFTILPKEDKGEVIDHSMELVTFAHEFQSGRDIVTTLGLLDTLEHHEVAPGTKVRLRLMNSSSNTKHYVLHGVPYTVVAIDGYDLHEPEEFSGKMLPIGGGGRYDVVFTMPDSTVSLGINKDSYTNTMAGIVFSSGGQGDFTLGDDRTIFDPYSYGSPLEGALSEFTSFDRQFTMVLDMFYIGFYNGKIGATWAINGEVFPNVPTFMVQEGDVVKTTVVNRTFADHPMHLHGHHIHVLSRNGKSLTGSPLVLDTLLVKPGETYEYAFVANNPGLWMDHCHNLEHAALGMSMHLAYSNVTTPFVLGGKYDNYPE